MLGDLLLKTVDKYVDVFIEALAAKYDLPKNELKELWKESSGRGKKAVSYKKMKLEDLKKLCQERDIDVKKSRKKQVYIEALEEHDKMESLDDDGHEETKSEPKEDEKVQEKNPVETDLVEAQPKEDVIKESEKVDETPQEVPFEPQLEEKYPDDDVDETPQESDVVEELKKTEKKEPKKKKVVAKKQKIPDVGIEKHVELIQSMEENKDVHDMNFTELKKFCKEKGMDIRQKTKQQLLDWVEDKEKTTDFSEFLTDVNDLI